jgi:hypothetical protein
MQAKPVARFDRFHIASLVAVAVLSGSLGAGIGVWAETSGGSQTPGITTSRQDTSPGGRSQRALDAETARFEGQARFYARLEGLDVSRGRRAETARLEAAADFYRSLSKRR